MPFKLPTNAAPAVCDPLALPAPPATPPGAAAGPPAATTWPGI